MVDRVIFDLDNTLLDSGSRYQAQLERFAEKVMDHFRNAPTASEILDVQQRLDKKSVKELGMDKKRFPQSLAQTWKYFCEQMDRRVRRSDVEDVLDMGWTVYEDVPEPLDGMVETLRSLEDRFQLILYTMGDAEVQIRKIRHYQLEQWFCEIHIVPVKDRGTLKPLVGPRPPSRVAIVGDSMRGEIKPGTDLGLLSIYRDTDYQWYYHEVEVEGDYHTIRKLPETLNVLDV